jgi:hypothetical protein
MGGKLPLTDSKISFVCSAFGEHAHRPQNQCRHGDANQQVT